MSGELLIACLGCGAAVLVGDRFCEACGRRLHAEPEPEPVALDDDRREVDLGVAAGVTNPGLVKRRNQDALFLERVDPAVIAVVCDGVSSSAAADAAARVACAAAGRALVETLPARDPEAATRTAIAAAQRAVLAIPWAPDQPLAAPSCTFVSALWDGEMVTVSSLGDSRAYWIGSDGTRRLTDDDSWAREAVDAGVLDERAAEADPRAHAITRWLGTDAPDEPPQIVSFAPADPGQLVVCSDGLWNYAPDTDALASLVRAHPPGAPLIDLARALVDFAIASGGHDNVTVTVTDVTLQVEGNPT